jgi:hypothetical protein
MGLEIAEFQYAWSEDMAPASPLALVEAMRPLLIALAQSGDANPLQAFPASSRTAADFP